MRKQLETIEELVEVAWENKTNDLFFCEIAAVPERLANFLKEKYAISIYGFFHILDNYVLRHVEIRHGNPETENLKGQVFVQREDFLLIPAIISTYDFLAYEFARNKHILIFKKIIRGHLYIYVAEIRSPKRKLICGQSLRILQIKKAD